MRRHCHTSASSMQAPTAAGKGLTASMIHPKAHQQPGRCSTSMAQASLAARSTSVRVPRHRAAAAAPDTLIAEESVQQPTVEFLGVLRDMQTVKGVLQTAADPDLVFDILTDYDSCSRVFRNISGSQTLFTDAGEKQVIQVRAAAG